MISLIGAVVPALVALIAIPGLVHALGAELFGRLLAIASGERSRSEQHGYGQQEFVPWQIGVIT